MKHKHATAQQETHNDMACWAATVYDFTWSGLQVTAVASRT